MEFHAEDPSDRSIIEGVTDSQGYFQYDDPWWFGSPDQATVTITAPQYEPHQAVISPFAQTVTVIPLMPEGVRDKIKGKPDPFKWIALGVGGVVLLYWGSKFFQTRKRIAGNTE
jgi:hypothetical protein